MLDGSRVVEKYYFYFGYWQKINKLAGICGC